MTHKRTITYPINKFGANALNEWWGAEGEGIITDELPEDEFLLLEFDVFKWAFDEFDIDIDDYEDDVIPFENIEDFINRIKDKNLDVPVFLNALNNAKKFGSIVHCFC